MESSWENGQDCVCHSYEQTDPASTVVFVAN